ncbi:MAG: Ig-like domain-containing protein [Lachnospiraceae bacterium]|nr:Ig-like domain-containing protein [Lachnospiraceae bacterium]
MKTQKFPMLSVCLTAALVFGSLGGANSKDAAAKAKQDKNVKQVKVTNLSGKKLTLAKGKSFTLKVKVVAKKKKVSQKVTFKSSNQKIVSVSASGVIKAKKKGTANVTVTSKADSSKTFQIKVTVTESVLVSKIELNQTSLSLDLSDEDYQLTATVYPSKASKKTVKWSSSDSEVASVSSTGLVTPEDEGEAVITAAATDGSGVIATCTVKVSVSEDDADEEDDADYDDETGYDEDETTDDRNTGDSHGDEDTDDGDFDDADGGYDGADDADDGYDDADDADDEFDDADDEFDDADGDLDDEEDADEDSDSESDLSDEE